MYACQGDSLSSSAWQATGPGIVKNIRGALELIQDSSELCQQQAPKKLTTEAAFMLFVLLAFVILTVIGSSIDAYEYFRKASTKKELSGDLQKKISRNKVPCSEDEKKLSKNSVWMKNSKLFLSCFSVQKNGQIILSTSGKEQHLSCLDGIRTIGFIIVVIGHTIGFYAKVVRNADIKFSETFSFIHVFPKGIYVVEVFFIISGILNGYSVSRQYHENKGEISWLSFPIRRFIKLTPMQIIVMGFYATLFAYVGSGPIWPKYETNPVCKKYWIWNLMYVNNFLTAEQQCINQYWYLACLMQLHVISPLFLISIIRKPKMGYTFTVLAIVISCLLRFVLNMQHNLVDFLMEILKDKPDISKIFDQMWIYFDNVHINTFTRLCSYPAGIAFGCYIHYLKLSKIKKNSLVTLSFGWIITIISLYLCSISAIDFQVSVYETAVLHSLKPIFLTCGLSWIIFACVTGQGGLLNKFLSWKFFKVLSRLSFYGYLIHMAVLDKHFLSFEELIDHTLFYMILTLTYLLLWTIAISFIFALIFGMPISRIIDLCHGIFEKKLHQKMN